MRRALTFRSVRLLKFLVFILVVAGSWSAYSLASWFVSPTRDLPEVLVVGKESFDARSGESALPESSGQGWLAISGEWGVNQSVLKLIHPSSEMNLVVFDAGAQGSIGATMTGKSYCGLVANVVDADNYVALLRANPYGVWNVVEVDHGNSKLIGTLPDPGTASVSAELRAASGRVWAFVGKSIATFPLRNKSIGTKAGFAQWGDATPACLFDDALLMTPT
jgi:hypothetical protein